MAFHACTFRRLLVASAVMLLTVSVASGRTSTPTERPCHIQVTPPPVPRVILSSHIDRYRSSQVLLSGLGLVMFVYIPLAWVVSRTTR